MIKHPAPFLHPALFTSVHPSGSPPSIALRQVNFLRRPFEKHAGAHLRSVTVCAFGHFFCTASQAQTRKVRTARSHRLAVPASPLYTPSLHNSDKKIRYQWLDFVQNRENSMAVPSTSIIHFDPFFHCTLSHTHTAAVSRDQIHVTPKPAF